MIKQHIYRRDKAGYRTVAASAGLTDSAWLSLLEQQTVLRCQSNSPAPVYYQYPLGYGLVLSRCAVDPNGRHGSYLVHQLVVDEPADIEALCALRPVSTSNFRDAYVSPENEVGRLPTLKPESLDDPAQLSAGFRLIDGWFDEARLARLVCTGGDELPSGELRAELLRLCLPSLVNDLGVVACLGAAVLLAVNTVF